MKKISRSNIGQENLLLEIVSKQFIDKKALLVVETDLKSKN